MATHKHWRIEQMSIVDALTAIFREVFDDDGITLSPELTADDVDGWDSLSHVNLIVTIETRFNIKFSQKELLTFKNVGNLMLSIEGKLPEHIKVSV
jgi:acyl carrier protein